MLRKSIRRVTTATGVLTGGDRAGSPAKPAPPKRESSLPGGGGGGGGGSQMPVLGTSSSSSNHQQHHQQRSLPNGDCGGGAYHNGEVKNGNGYNNRMPHLQHQISAPAAQQHQVTPSPPSSGGAGAGAGLVQGPASSNGTPKVVRRKKSEKTMKIKFGSSSSGSKSKDKDSSALQTVQEQEKPKPKFQEIIHSESRNDVSPLFQK